MCERSLSPARQLPHRQWPITRYHHAAASITPCGTVWYRKCPRHHLLLEQVARNTPRHHVTAAAAGGVHRNANVISTTTNSQTISPRNVRCLMIRSSSTVNRQFSVKLWSNFGRKIFHSKHQIPQNLYTLHSWNFETVPKTNELKETKVQMPKPLRHAILFNSPQTNPVTKQVSKWNKQSKQCSLPKYPREYSIAPNHCPQP